MATDHTVKQGEHAVSIAASYGFANYLTIWNHPNNSQLKQKRKNPHVLLPGDVIHIPDKEVKVESCETGNSHRFVLSGESLKLRLVLKDFDDKPLANMPCELEIDGMQHQLTTKENGLIEADIPKTAAKGTLKVTSLGLEFPVHIGHLDPVEETTGWRARLINLGYYAGSVNDSDPDRYRHALEEFQCDYSLKVTGQLDAATLKKLKDLYGC